MSRKTFNIEDLEEKLKKVINGKYAVNETDSHEMIVNKTMMKKGAEVILPLIKKYLEGDLDEVV